MSCSEAPLFLRVCRDTSNGNIEVDVFHNNIYDILHILLQLLELIHLYINYLSEFVNFLIEYAIVLEQCVTLLQNNNIYTVCNNYR